MSLNIIVPIFQGVNKTLSILAQGRECYTIRAFHRRDELKAAMAPVDSRSARRQHPSLQGLRQRPSCGADSKVGPHRDRRQPGHRQRQYIHFCRRRSQPSLGTGAPLRFSRSGSRRCSLRCALRKWVVGSKGRADRIYTPALLSADSSRSKWGGCSGSRRVTGQAAVVNAIALAT